MSHAVVRALALSTLLLSTRASAQERAPDPGLVKWVLASMTRAQPTAPWQATYRQTAEIFAKVATDSPLFRGVDGPKKTAAWFVSTAWFESRFDPKAVGDCRKRDKAGKCISLPNSLCMFQVGISNLPYLGLTKDQILESTEVCTRAARKMMKISFGVCRGRPSDEWLGHYASGGGVCGGLRESRHRVNKAKWLFTNVKAKE